jgi:hypothetical protein
VTGTPQFDFHRWPAFTPDRASTLHRLGLGPSDRYILHAANSAYFTPSEPRLVSALASELHALPHLRHHRIVVRPHPLDDFVRWDELRRDHPTVVVALPWGTSQGPFGPEEQQRLLGAVRHADVCLNMASSISLDAAALDTPVICLGFAAQGTRAEERFCREVYRVEHYAPLLESGGVRLVTDMPSLLREISAYVGDRARDTAARQRLVATEIGALDGQASCRLASLIAGLVMSAAPASRSGERAPHAMGPRTRGAEA